MTGLNPHRDGINHSRNLCCHAISPWIVEVRHPIPLLAYDHLGGSKSSENCVSETGLKYGRLLVTGTTTHSSPDRLNIGSGPGVQLVLVSESAAMIC